MTMTISIDDDLKRDFSAVCHDIGMSPSTAFSVFAKTVVRERRIPFELSADSAASRARRDYETSVNNALWESYHQFEEGRDCSREEFNQLRNSVWAS